jgi:hypothetical protein
MHTCKKIKDKKDSATVINHSPKSPPMTTPRLQNNYPKMAPLKG